MNGFTTKQKLFVEAYLANPNATQAAIKAGYSEKTAYSAGQRLLKNVEIAAALGKRIEEAIITADEILTDVKEIAKSRGEKANDRLKAYELLGKHLAMWTERHEVDATVEHTGEIAFIEAAKKIYGDG